MPSLAQQIAGLDAPAPVDLDPEAIFTDLQSISPDISKAHYIDVGRSTLRKLHDSISDPKYNGVKISRKQILEQSDGSSESPEESEPEADDGPESSDDLGEDDQNEQVQELPPPNGADAETADITTSLRQTQDADRKKGLAVSRQIGIWDSLLDARIRLQKSATASNTLPLSSELPRDDPQFQESLTKMLSEAVLLSEQLFGLQESLLEVNDSITHPARKRRKIETPESASHSDLTEYLDAASEDASHLEHAYHPHLVQTLSKWSSKIQAVAPSVLLPANRNAFSKDRQHLKTAVQLVDENLSSHDKLLSRTQQWRGKGQRLGVEPGDRDDEQNIDTEIFDDTDFYQQLLRDVIDARDASGANDWMAIQKQKKAKKKVDTKASKGRKLRFDIHEKLQNFMAPIHVKGTWHEEQIDELFSSLLGRGFENAIDTQVDDILPGTHTDDLERLPSGALEGFRVFG
ncbi:hypothetical protein GYMLUDRAFT_42585 [Collybiopsis luxurians FD-317 M1]|uniref:Protein BFR2 n=1 Tax=Collybiopsis luxurians FD-317 M1 TaxID=944289 RepID=A0A0D0BD38_9AGAR|nr:hypothetical protein GYMLUDRAFT_42585 [Collybiopsis luxurians FD-317 M1]